MRKNLAKSQRQVQRNHSVSADKAGKNSTIERETTITSYREEVFTGPFPHPDMLKAYRDVDSSIPGMIMNMAVEESKHRRSIESRIVTWQSRTFLINNIFAIVAMCIILFVGYLFMINDHAKEGAAIIAVTCLGVVGIIITRSFKKDNTAQSEP
jgi:uncharacterized membrane protein